MHMIVLPHDNRGGDMHMIVHMILLPQEKERGRYAYDRTST